MATTNPGDPGLIDPGKNLESINWDLNTVKNFAERAIKISLGLAALVALFYLIIGGYYYLFSAGSEEQAEKGKKTIFWAIIGLVVVASAYAIVNFATDLFGKPEFMK